MFHVGQKVVCVVKGTWDCTDGEIVPINGRIYTVREVYRNPGENWSLRLEEIRNTLRLYLQGVSECGFCIEAFRPIEERKTSIAIFEAMLNSAPQKAVEVAE